MTRRLALTFVVAALGVGLAPHGAEAATTSALPDTVGIYGIYSGFAKARTDRVSITVGPMPASAEDSVNDHLDQALDAWNTAAGWWLFHPDPDGVTPDVVFVDDAERECPNFGACVTWVQFDSGWYRQCVVHLWPWPTPLSTVTHELGHCLGFIDVATSTDNAYRGIMSYARSPLLTPDNPQDVASLAAVGYRDGES